jgi:hypothetical protein
LLCANLADPAPASAARGRGPVATAAPSLSAGHRPPLAACGGSAAPSLSARHKPPPGACGGSAALVAVPGLSAGHRPPPAACGGNATLLLLLVCQPGTGLYVLLAITVLLLLSGCGGHGVQIVPLAVNGRQPLPRGGVHNNRIVLQDVHEELQGGEFAPSLMAERWP